MSKSGTFDGNEIGRRLKAMGYDEGEIPFIVHKATHVLQTLMGFANRFYAEEKKELGGSADDALPYSVAMALFLGVGLFVDTQKYVFDDVGDNKLGPFKPWAAVETGRDTARLTSALPTPGGAPS